MINFKNISFDQKLLNNVVLYVNRTVV